MKKMNLTTKIIIGSILGIIVGLVLGENVKYIKWIGDVFLRLVSMVVPILIFCAIVDSVASLDLKDLGRMGSKTVGWFFFTTSIAALVGITAISIIKPTATLQGLDVIEYTGYIQGNFIDLIVNFIPNNVFAAFTNNSIIQIIIFGAFLGYTISVLSKTNEKALLVLDIIQTLKAIMMKMVGMFMHIAPYGIFALLAKVVGTTGVEMLIPLLKYVLTVTGANLVFFLLYSLYVSLRCKVSVVQLFKNITRTIILGMTTGSSAMTLPMEFKDADERLGIPRKVSDFVLPLGNAINTNGAAITTTIASITCAYMFGIELSIQNYLMIALYAALATFGNTTVPGGGIVAIAVVFQMANLPLEGVALFAGVDYFTGLTRIILNTGGDIYTAMIIAVGEKEGIDKEIFNRPNNSEPELQV